MEVLRIGLIGGGRAMSRLHMPGLLKLPGVEISLVCNATMESAERFIGEHGIRAKPVRSWEDVCQSPDVDVVWVGAPPALHAQAVCAALVSEKHAFCQAPLCINAAETTGMAAAALGRPHLVTAACPSSYGFKYSPFILELLRRETLGRLLHIGFQGNCNVGADPAAPPHWSQLSEMNGVNFLNVTLIADTIFRWVGPPSRLRAQTRVFAEVRAESLIQVPDYAIVSAEWENGMSGALVWSGVSHGPERNRMELHGERGSVIYDFDTEQIWLCQRGRPKFQKIEVPPDFVSEWRVEEGFIRAVRREGPKPRPDFLDGARCLALAEAIHASAHTADWAELHMPDEEFFVT